MTVCNHQEVECLNPYEFIRKYRCQDCGAVVMCVCDEQFGRRFLPHQLDFGTVLETQERIAVSDGFQAEICRACRGLPEEAAPKAPLYGSSGKVVRYYWREIYFETTRRFADWLEKNKPDNGQDSLDDESQKERARIGKEVIEEFKRQHEVSPKYSFDEESREEVIRDCKVEVVRLDGVHVRQGKRVGILLGERTVSPEAFVEDHYGKLGYQTMMLESRPIHVLFGIYTWLLFQDPADELGRIVGFGDRRSVDDKVERPMVQTILPQDFGTIDYAKRRSAEIDEHFSSMIPDDKDELLWLFDYWLDHSDGFRNYLWAHRQDDIERARKLVEILPPTYVIRTLRYLVGNYWQRYLGWPDILAYKEEDILLLEVKSSNDKLSKDQLNWIKGNAAELAFPFKIVKIHRKQP